MESGWTSKYNILRDLSVAQGREVPVEIKNTVTKDEKPPAHNYAEESEEKFFEHCVSNEDFSTGPDITLIQQMLDMVREINVTDVEVDNNTALEICKSSNNQDSGDSSKRPEIVKDSGDTTIKKKREKNVAVASLIAAYGDTSENKVPKTPKLLKPHDFVFINKTYIQTNPINEASEPHGTPTKIVKDIKSAVSPTFMFKKKSPSKKSSEDSHQHQSSSPKSVKSDCVSPLEVIKPISFVPSSHAGEYYQKFVERSETQAKAKEDIWSQAERKMKEIEVKRLQESITSPINIQECSETAELQDTDIYI